MKNLITIIILCAAFLPFGSCKEDKLAVYEMKDNVYFKHKRWGSPNAVEHSTTMEYDGVSYTAAARVQSKSLDTIAYSFAGSDKDKDIMIIPVIVVGRVADADRRFGYKILPTTTVEEGTDFKVLDAFIPANQTSGGIVIELYKESVAQEGASGIVDFQLVPNEYFNTAYDSIPSSSSSTTLKVSTLTFRLRYSNTMDPPSSWNAHDIGTFTAKKFNCFNIATGLDMDYWYGEDEPSRTLMPALRQQFIKWLAEMKNSGNEVFEEDGITPMSVVKY